MAADAVFWIESIKSITSGARWWFRFHVDPGVFVVFEGHTSKSRIRRAEEEFFLQVAIEFSRSMWTGPVRSYKNVVINIYHTSQQVPRIVSLTRWLIPPAAVARRSPTIALRMSKIEDDNLRRPPLKKVTSRRWRLKVKPIDHSSRQCFDSKRHIALVS